MQHDRKHGIIMGGEITPINPPGFRRKLDIEHHQTCMISVIYTLLQKHFANHFGPLIAFLKKLRYN